MGHGPADHTRWYIYILTIFDRKVFRKASLKLAVPKTLLFVFCGLFVLNPHGIHCKTCRLHLFSVWHVEFGIMSIRVFNFSHSLRHRPPLLTWEKNSPSRLEGCERFSNERSGPSLFLGEDRRSRCRKVAWHFDCIRPNHCRDSILLESRIMRRSAVSW